MRSLFCLYGSPRLKEPWLRNRWSLTAGAGELRYWICGAQPEQQFSLSAPIRAWQYQATLYDLDRQQSENRLLAADGVVDLGATDHDFALVLKRR
ncbi:MAG: hypothetical protein NTY19_48320 [Planctomycetota bacterium]|nr:hypothetical protein [Planctomycetota bacterium]